MIDESYSDTAIMKVILSAQINMTNYFTTGKKIWNESLLKAAKNKLDDVILISQSEYDIKPVDYLSVPRPFDSLR